LIEPVFALQESDEDEGQAETGSDQLPLSWLPTANYVGVYGTLEADEYYELVGQTERGDGPIVFDRRITFANLLRGQSKTLLVGERKMSMVPSTWLGVDLRGQDATCRLVGSAITHPNCDECDECEFTSRHNGGANFVWADGHVEMVSDDIDPKAYRDLAKRLTD
jgi:prepilin-type processing-associated H-X9-DG protein